MRVVRRSRLAPAFLVWQADEFERIVLPIRGNGMWSALYGYIALEPDMNTIADAVFYEQNETPGLGDRLPGRAGLRSGKERKSTMSRVSCASP